jgi:thiol-disulfide isomerase/thioredoxin
MHVMRLALVLALPACLAAAPMANAAPQYGGKGTTPPATGGDAPAKGPKEAKEAKGETRFYEKLDKEDRAALEANVGFAIPTPPESLEWIGGEAMDRGAFRDKVTVIQSVSGKQNPRAALEKLKKSLPEGVALVGLHVPDGADRADNVLKNEPPCPVAVDASGTWCDALGVWKRPVNIVVDKTGAIRYAGLSDAGLKAKLPELLQEQVDESVSAVEKPAPEAAAGDAKVPWPEFLSPVSSAADKRGQSIPGFRVGKWLTPAPDPGQRLVAVDFWATWCGPCKAAIPHMNELNQKFGKDILFVGISDEQESAFNSGMKKSNLKPDAFTYALALDPASMLKGFFEVKGIPHMAIWSPDGVVRWQGHPMTLSEEDIEKLVAANRANAKPAAGKASRGWANEAAKKQRK